jgi:outer membrane protein insertion porin family/translocation and assembly module TamA
MHRPLLTIAVYGLSLCSCVKAPVGRSPIDDVTVRGATLLGASDVADKLATAPSPKFLYLFRGVVYDYEIFDANALQRDLARVERFYRARGYYQAHARAGRVHVREDGHVTVELVVEEGRPTLTKTLSVDGLGAVPEKLRRAVVSAARGALHPGEPFDEDKFAAAEVHVKKALTDAGYAYARTHRDAYLDLVRQSATVLITTAPGQTATFGTYAIDGLDPDGNGPRKQEIQEPPLRRTIDIVAGRPYSTATIDDAVQALLDLGVLSAVEIVPDLAHPETRVVNLSVHLEPTRLRQIRLGGGIEIDEIKDEIHAIVGWENHDFLGGLRDFRVDLKPGVVLFPTRVDNWVAPQYVFPEEKLQVQFRQPGFIESRTTAFIRPAFNVFPLLVQTDTAASSPVVGYLESKTAVGVDRQIWKLFTSLSYNVQVEDPFAYKDALDPDLHALVIAYPELVTRLEFVDNRSHPHEGVALGNSLQIAGGPFGGNAHDVKLQPEAKGYVPLGPNVTFAARAALGFLWSTNYGGTIKDNQLDTPTTAGSPGPTLAERVSDLETVLFRGLYSGGPSSNRGYPIRGVSPHGVVPFLNPATASQQVANSCTPAANGTVPNPALCEIPIGGFTLWEWSNELRIHIKGPLSTALFCDMGDVSPHEGDVRFSYLHLSCGLGVRYDTPVGPVRLDVGYRINGLQVLSRQNAEQEAENGVQPTILGLPLAFDFGIGEAY